MPHDYPANALPKGYIIKNYQINDVLGVGGFGITYLAEDVQLKTKVAIKEYLPSDLAVRGNTLLKSSDSNPSQLQPKSQADKETYLWGLERFLNEAQAVASLKHPNIVQVKHFFEANNTAYFVMDYEEGEALNKLLKKGERVEEDEIYKLTLPLLDGLKKVHSKHYLHRDISPSNIYIQDDGDNPILIDFGAARQSLVGKSHSMSSIIKVGYAPYEQYQTRGNQGPWSDIYAFGAVLYQLITGSVPVESTERINALVNDLPDPLTPAIEIGKGKYSKKLLRAIDWALNVREKDRPQSVDQWVGALQGAPINTTASVTTYKNTQKLTTKQHNKKGYIIGGLAIISAIMIGSWLYFGKTPTSTPAPTKTISKKVATESKNDSEKDEKITTSSSEEEPIEKNQEITSLPILDEPVTKPEQEVVADTCESGNAQKCFDIGMSYSLGEGVEKNERKASKYFLEACNAGHGKGCLIVASMYSEGIGVKKSDPLASKYNIKSCKLGNGSACYLLGINYQNGLGVKKDSKTAAIYFKKSCDSLYADGCIGIGVLYEKGFGVKKDFKKAKVFFSKGCDLGNPVGCL